MRVFESLIRRIIAFSNIVCKYGVSVLSTRAHIGAIQMLCNQVGGGGVGCQIFRNKVLRRLNVISVTRGGWRSNFQEKSVT